MDPKPHQLGFLRSLIVHIQTMLVAGLLVTLPIGVTIFILKFFFDLFDPILQPLLKFLPGPQIPGLGIITLVISVYLVGLIATQVVGGRLINVGHRVIERIPVVKSIYSTTRTGVEILTGSKDHPYRGVVLVEFPRKGMKAIGLVTANLGVMDGSETVAVYIPTTPVPSSGFLVLMPLSEVTLTEMSVDDAMKMIISGGILAKEILVPAVPNWDKIPKAPATVPVEDAD